MPWSLALAVALAVCAAVALPFLRLRPAVAAGLMLLALGPVLAQGWGLLRLSAAPSGTLATGAEEGSEPVAPEPQPSAERGPSFPGAEPGLPAGEEGWVLVERTPEDPAAIAERVDSRRAVEATEAFEQAQTRLRGLYRERDFPALAAAAEEEIQRFPETVEPYALGGLAYARLGDEDRARELLRVVMDRAEDDPDVRLAMLALRMLDPMAPTPEQEPIRVE